MTIGTFSERLEKEISDSVAGLRFVQETQIIELKIICKNSLLNVSPTTIRQFRKTWKTGTNLSTYQYFLPKGWGGLDSQNNPCP